MAYVPIVMAIIVFFLSFGFFVLAWSKKPTKKHLQEIEEASMEIAHQIQVVTDESLHKMEQKMKELDEKYQVLEQQYETMKSSYEKNLKRMNEQRIKEEARTKEKRKETNDSKSLTLSLRDEKAKKIYALAQKGYTEAQIAKEMGMNIGVVQVYMNMIEFPKIG